MNESKNSHALLLDEAIFGLTDNSGQLVADLVSAYIDSPHTASLQVGRDIDGQPPTAIDSSYLHTQVEPDQEVSRLSSDKREAALTAGGLAVEQLLFVATRLIEPEIRIAPVSEELDADPRKTLSLPVETTMYSEFLRENQPMLYQKIRSAQKSMPVSPNDVNAIDCIVAIPVAGHQEFGGIYRTLESYSKQALGADRFEIVLNVNMPAGLRRGSYIPDQENIDSFQKTIAEIERFQQDYPDMVVRYFTTTYRGSQSPIGRIRSDLWAVINEDLVDRGREADILVVSNDADTTGMDSGYLAEMAKLFKDTGADIVTAKLRWEPIPGLPSSAMANKYLRFHTFLDLVLRNSRELLHTSDANTGISMAMYAAIGGFNRRLEIAEMIDLADRIRQRRDFYDQEASAKPVQISADTWLKTDSRRVAKAFSIGLDLNNAWNLDEIPFGANDEVRTAAADPDIVEQHASRLWREWYMDGAEYYMQHVDDDTYLRLMKGAFRIQGLDETTVRSRTGFIVELIDTDVIVGFPTADEVRAWDLGLVTRELIKEVEIKPIPGINIDDHNNE